MESVKKRIASYLPNLNPSQYNLNAAASAAVNYLLDSYFSKIDFRVSESSKNHVHIPGDLDSLVKKEWLGCDLRNCFTLNSDYPTWAIARNAWAFDRIFNCEHPKFKNVDYISEFRYGEYLKDSYGYASQSKPFNISLITNAIIPVNGNYFVECTKTGSHLLVRFDFCHNSNGCNITVISSEENRKTAEAFIIEMNASLVMNDIYYRQCLSYDSGTFDFSSVIPTTWDQIILKQKIKDKIKDNTIGILNNSDNILKLGLCPNRNTMLISPPGMAKTTIFRAISSEMNGRATVIWCTGRSIVYPEHVKQLFEAARSMSPCIIFIEDMDLFGKDRSSGYESHDSRILNEFLSCLDGTVENKGVIVLASTNDVSSMDEALVARPGRFDVKIEMPLPDNFDRDLMLKSFFASYGAKFDQSVTQSVWENVIGSTEGLSGAYLKEFVKSVVFDAINNGNYSSIGETYSCSVCSETLTEAIGHVMENFAIGNRAKKHHEFRVNGQVSST